MPRKLLYTTLTIALILTGCKGGKTLVTDVEYILPPKPNLGCYRLKNEGEDTCYCRDWQLFNDSKPLTVQELLKSYNLNFHIHADCKARLDAWEESYKSWQKTYK